MFNRLKSIVKTVSNNNGIIYALKKVVLPKALVTLFILFDVSPLIWLTAVLSIVNSLSINSFPKRRMCLCIGLIAWTIPTLLFYNLDNIVIFCVALTLDASALLYFLLKKLVFR